MSHDIFLRKFEYYDFEGIAVQIMSSCLRSHKRFVQIGDERRHLTYQGGRILVISSYLYRIWCAIQLHTQSSMLTSTLLIVPDANTGTMRIRLSGVVKSADCWFTDVQLKYHQNELHI